MRALDDHWHFQVEDFFSGIPKERDAFLALATCRKYEKNDAIFFEDDAGVSCYYIQRGIVRIFSIAPSGKEPIYFLRRSGEFFGLAEVIESLPRKANAQALTPCVIYEIGKGNFEKLLADNFRIARKVIITLGRRLRYLGEQVANLMTCDVDARLAKLLVYMAHDQLGDESAWEKPVLLSTRITQEQMAAMIGSCQQTVSKALKDFQEKGLIKLDGRKVFVLHPLDLLQTIGNRN